MFFGGVKEMKYLEYSEINPSNWYKTHEYLPKNSPEFVGATFKYIDYSNEESIISIINEMSDDSFYDVFTSEVKAWHLMEK